MDGQLMCYKEKTRERAERSSDKERQRQRERAERHIQRDREIMQDRGREGYRDRTRDGIVCNATPPARSGCCMEPLSSNDCVGYMFL